MTLELGRSIAASCGTYLTRVVDVKRNKNQNYAIVDGGMHQMVYYGQSMAMQLPDCRLFPARAGEPRSGTCAARSARSTIFWSSSSRLSGSNAAISSPLRVPAPTA